jgi:hypothetical protein
MCKTILFLHRHKRVLLLLFITTMLIIIFIIVTFWRRCRSRSVSGPGVRDSHEIPMMRDTHDGGGADALPEGVVVDGGVLLLPSLVLSTGIRGGISSDKDLHTLSCRESLEMNFCFSQFRCATQHSSELNQNCIKIESTRCN